MINWHRKAEALPNSEIIPPNPSSTRSLLKQIESTLAQSEEKYRTLFEQANDAIFLENLNGQILDVNQKACELLGYSHQELLKLHVSDIVPHEVCQQMPTLIKTLKEKGEFQVETYNIKKDGTHIPVECSASLLKMGSGDNVLTIIRDISQRKNAENKIKESEKKYSELVENSIDYIESLDKEGRFTFVNRTVEEAFGLSKEQLLGKYAFDFICADERENVRNLFQMIIEKKYTSQPVECRLKLKNKTIWLKATYSLITDQKDNVTGISIIATDITNFKKIEEEREILLNNLQTVNTKLQEMALIDVHTGVFNYRYFCHRFNSEIKRAARTLAPVSLIMLDIDFFKVVNDTYGPEFGDSILKEFAHIIKNNVRDSDIVCRYGGEEFTIILTDTSRSGANEVAHKLLKLINITSLGESKHNIQLKASFGIVTYPDDALYDTNLMISGAEQAIHQAKNMGGNRIINFKDISQKAIIDAAVTNGTDTLGVLKEKLAVFSKRSEHAVLEAIYALNRTLETKDRQTSEHSEKMLNFATKIAQNLEFNETEIENIRRSAMFHDLGKIGIPEHILLKPGKLTREEFEIIKKHPKIGAEIISSASFLKDTIPGVLYHHEKYNGRGYLLGLKAGEIPVAARIIAVVDVYEALISDRPYRKAFSQKEALEIIREDSGKAFDPKIVNLFTDILKNSLHL